METRDIDRTHIIALQEVSGQFRNMELPISHPEQFIAELKAMIDNPNRTVWDMQSHFITRYPKRNVYIDYIHPYLYDSSYVGSTQYPRLSEYNELRKSWNEVGNAARESYLASCKQNGSNPETAVTIQAKAVNDLKKRQKSNFFSEAMRWIDANCYDEKAAQLRNNDSVKMFSKENIGWLYT